MKLRQSQLLNKNWLFARGFVAENAAQVMSSGSAVVLPHTVVEVPYNHFDESLYLDVFCYQRVLETTLWSAQQNGQRALLMFEGVMAVCDVYVNGTLLLTHKGGYTPFEVDITDALRKDGNDLLSIRVDCSERGDTPPFGGQLDYLTYGGIYRDVHLAFVDPVSVAHVKVETADVLSSQVKTRVKVNLRQPEHHREIINVIAELLDPAGNLVSTVERAQHSDEGIALDFPQLAEPRLWRPEAPHLYKVRIRLGTLNGVDVFEQAFGYRTAEFKADGFYLNGELFKIRGINRHQAWPYLGYAVGPRAQRHDADRIKFELGFNLVRTSHYPQSKAFIERCDDIGLLVFEEIPGWQHIGDAQWQAQVMRDVEDMIVRDWNSPSVILWGVRINESPDCDALYKETNRLARALDPTRQTGGVRCIPDSTLLEDVYTMNDFVHSGDNIILHDQQQVTGLNHNVPYLVTEYNGHMFPTKRFDAEERQHEHVLRHLKILDRSYGADDISGCIAWCLFDYNTHKDFGSGDRICYHGITDMFRIEKHAAWVYASQLPPSEKPVLHAVTLWSRGERSISGCVPLIVLTNCDYVEFQYGDQPARRVYPDRDHFPNLPYAPVVLDERSVNPAELGEWGLAWDGIKLVGFVDDVAMTEQVFAANPQPASISVTLDDSVLSAAEKELTRVVIKGLDQMGNPLPYWNPVVSLSVSGPARIVGPQQLPLIGGVAGSFLETTLQPGQVELTVSVPGFDHQTVALTVIEPQEKTSC